MLGSDSMVVQKIKKNTAVEQNDAVIIARLLVVAIKQIHFLYFVKN